MKSIGPLAAVCGFALFALGGCSSDPSTARVLSNGLPFTKQAPKAAPEFIAVADTKAPRYIAAVEAKPEGVAAFVRQTVSDTSGVGTWVGADGSQLIFDDGILVGTRGFGGDVLASDVTQSLALVKSLNSGISTRLMTLIDGEDRAVTRAFKCRITPGGLDTVPVGARQITARTTVEECKGDVASFINFYWVVPGTGEIIQSSQWAGTLTGKVSLRVLPVEAG